MGKARPEGTCSAASPAHSVAFLATLRPMGDMSPEDLDPYVRIAAEAGIKMAGRLSAMVGSVANLLFQSFSYGGCGHSSGDRDVQGQAF